VSEQRVAQRGGVLIEVKRSYRLGGIITAREHPRATPIVVALEQIGYWAVVDRRDDLPAVRVKTDDAAMQAVVQLAAKVVNA
jgi:hypothetical protein